MKHTPGPWHADESKSFYVFACGSLAEQAGVKNGPFVANASTAANARLIARAPEFRAALAWALDQIEDDLDPSHQAALANARSLLKD